MPSMIEITTVGTVLVVTLALIVLGSMQLIGERLLTRRLDGLKHDTLPLAIARPAPPGVLATILSGGLEGRREIECLLIAAGYLTTEGALRFGLIRVAATLVSGFGLFLAMTALRPPSIANWAVPVAVAALVYLGAKYILKASSARRSRKISNELPFTLDIFVMMVESGASLDQCFRIFSMAEGRAAPIVQAAVGLLVDDIQRGMPYDLALSRWSDRLGVNGARELSAVFRQSLAHGTELAATLREFSREFSERRVFSAREAIGKKTTQMTIAMLVLLMPALMIVLAGPAVSTLGGTLEKLSK